LTYIGVKLRRDDYRAIIIVILSYSFATLTGFFRQAVVARYLGVGRAADIYLVAFALPEFVFIALPIVLYPAFIPLFTESRHRFNEAAAWKLVQQTAIGLSFLMILLTLLAGWGAPIFIRWLSPGFSPSDQSIAIRALRLMLPSLCLMSLATLSSAVLIIYRKFAPPALMTAVFNITFAIVLIALPVDSLIERASWAVTIGAAAAFLFQIPILCFYHLRPNTSYPRSDLLFRSNDSSIGVNQVVRLAGPLVAGYAVHHFILLVDRAMATRLEPGSVAALSYANHLALVIGQLSGMAVSMVLFPLLADQISQKDLDGVRTSLADALRLIWLIALPTSIGLIVLREPIISILFERGAFDQLATAAVSAPLVWYSLAVLVDASGQPFWRVIYAQKSSWTVLGVNGIQTIIRFLGNIILINLIGYVGLALSAALGLTLQTLILGWLIYHRIGTFWTAAWWQEIRRIMVATISAAFVTSVLVYSWTSPPILQILIVGIIGGFVYLVVLQLTKIQKEYKTWR
jgi:putative peptidoglycan lipid II flippase